MHRKILISAAPELIDMKFKSPKQALKKTIAKTARQELGDRHQCVDYEEESL